MFAPAESAVNKFVTVCGDDPKRKATDDNSGEIHTCGSIAAVGVTHCLCSQIDDTQEDRMAYEGCPVTTCGNDPTWTLTLQTKKNKTRTKTCRWTKIKPRKAVSLAMTDAPAIMLALFDVEYSTTPVLVFGCLLLM